jgi:hypothetical protein
MNIETYFCNNCSLVFSYRFDNGSKKGYVVCPGCGIAQSYMQKEVYKTWVGQQISQDRTVENIQDYDKFSIEEKEHLNSIIQGKNLISFKLDNEINIPEEKAV